MNEMVEKAEQGLAQSIKDLLNKNPGDAVELDIKVMYNLWFRGKKVDFNTLTGHMLRFAGTYGLDYVIILDRKSRIGGLIQYLAVRFWESEEKVKLLEESEKSLKTKEENLEELEEKEDAVCETGEET